MKPTNKIWLNGKIVPIQKANFLNFHQGLNYGACVYEGIRFHHTKNGPAIFRLAEHIDRFFYSASVLQMDLKISKADFIKAIKDLVKETKLQSGYLRPLAFYSEPKMGINIIGAELAVAVFVWPWKENTVNKPARVKIVKTRRLHPATVDFKAKIGGYYANNLLGFLEARRAGYDEPLFLDTKGFIAEGAINNIFIVKKKALYTPKSGNILAGITRDSIIQIARASGLKVYEKAIKPEFLRGADEVFLTGTGVELERVIEVKGYFSQSNVEAGIFEVLNDRYQKIAKGEDGRYKKWLTWLE